MASPPLVLNWTNNQPIPLIASSLLPNKSGYSGGTTYTVQTTDYLTQINSFNAGGTLTLTLPNTLPQGFLFFVSAITDSIVLNTTGGVNILIPSGDGTGIVTTSYSLNVTNQLQSVAIYFDGGSFWLLTTQGTGQNVDIEFIISGGGATITTGTKGYLRIPVALNILGWRVIADQSGSIVLDVLRNNGFVPTTSIIGSGNKPTLSSSQFAFANVSGWTSTSLINDDWLGFVVDSATTVTQITLVLVCRRQ